MHKMYEKQITQTKLKVLMFWGNERATARPLLLCPKQKKSLKTHAGFFFR